MKTAILEPKDRIIVALDVNEPRKALELVETLRDHVGAFKVGLEFNTSSFAKLVTTDAVSLNALWYGLAQLFEKLEGKLMYDGKFDDIPNTMAGAAKGLAPLNPKFFTVHATSGKKAVKSAVENRGEATVLAVTILTSLSYDDIFEMGIDLAHVILSKPETEKPGYVQRLVVSLALMAEKAGAGGIVCSPMEVAELRKKLQPETVLVTPGVRPTSADVGDQKRVMTPGEAIKAGADYLVIGRPITDAQDPVAAADAITDEIATALG